MTQSTTNQMRSLFVLAILASAITITPATAAGGALKVDITRYEPYPAEIGKYVDIWVNVKNMGGGTAEDVTVELVPKYPFTLDSGRNARQNKGSIGTDPFAMYEYRLFVASDAKPGTHEITIRYQGEKGTTWSEKDFEIKVGTDTLDSRGTLKLEAIKTDPEVLIPGDVGTVTLIVGFGYLMELRQESGVNIYCDAVCTQGAAENLTGMESVKVHEMVCNTGDKEAKNVTVTVMFTDTAHDRVVRKTALEGVDLPSDGTVSVEFDAEYLRELTMPKTSVDETIQVDWIEDGELKTSTTGARAQAAEEEKEVLRYPGGE